MANAISVPNPISFEQAITLTESLMVQMPTLSEPALESTLSALLASENGARGFFVTYLTDEGNLPDQPSAAVIRALQSSPALVAELLVKNLAMSSAMAIAHRRNQNEALAQGSDRVQRRTIDLIQKAQLPEVSAKAAQLQASVSSGSGDYEAFLQRWGYDAEQRQAIAHQMQHISQVEAS